MADEIAAVATGAAEAGTNQDAGAGGVLLAGAPPAAPQEQQQTQQSGDAAKKEGGDQEQDKPAGAPEQYADFELPEGVTLDAEVNGEFTALAKDLNLTQEQAQSLATLGAKITQKNAGAFKQQQDQALVEWTQASRADQEFGGDKLQENLAVANKALSEFGSPELIGLLKDSALGSHPEFVRLLYRVGKATSGDKFIPNGTASDGARDVPIEDRLYPQKK